MKSIFWISFFTLLIRTNSFGQIQAQTELEVYVENGLTIYFQSDFDLELAKEAQDVLETFNSEKIISSSYDASVGVFSIKHTSYLNKIELLAIFREIGMEAYFIENSIKYKLNATATSLIVHNIPND